MRMQQSEKQKANLKSKRKQYRQFMATSAAKSIEKQAAIAGFADAEQRNRPLDPFFSIANCEYNRHPH